VFPLFDPTFVMLLPAFALALWAQHRVKSAYRKYSEVASRGGNTGAQAAWDLLRRHGIDDVAVESTEGELSDNYDPRSKTLHLSQNIYSQPSIAALAIAAHEVGHAMQDSSGYTPLRWRANLVPVANFGSMGAFPLFIIGLFLNTPFLMDIGIGLYMAALAFYLVTLPVEFDASRRAMVALSNGGNLAKDEIVGAKKVLNAAALTYVASAAMAVSQLFRMLILRDD